MTTPRISGLRELRGKYDAIFCDVWGVLHNGVSAYLEASDALTKFRWAGGYVVMITNSPKPAPPVIKQMGVIGVPKDGVFDAVVSSGDATRALIEELEGPIYFLGPDRDKILFEGLNVEFTQLEKATAVVCTGLFDDEAETPDDYADLLKSIKQFDLPFVCANPDIVVERGSRMIWCGGALARDYATLGGETRLVGKPHSPIYNRARQQLDGIAPGRIPDKNILAIGDGMPTDVKGAMDYGLDLLYVSAGIHAEAYGDPLEPDDALLQQFLRENNATPVAYMPRLTW